MSAANYDISNEILAGMTAADVVVECHHMEYCVSCRDKARNMRCIICDRRADGFTRQELGWHDEVFNRVYLCEQDYETFYQRLDDAEWQEV